MAHNSDRGGMVHDGGMKVKGEILKEREIGCEKGKEVHHFTKFCSENTNFDSENRIF